MKKLEKGLWYFFLQKLLYLLWNLYSWRKKCGQVGTLPLLGLKQELLYNTLYQIPFIKYHLSNTVYQIPFIKYPLSNTIYEMPFIKYLSSNTIFQIMINKYHLSNTICTQNFFLMNQSMNQWMNESINRVFLERHICR